MTARLAAAALAFVALSAIAQEEHAARSLAATCAGCHGTDGRSIAPHVPALAGVPESEMLGKLRAFRNGGRPSSVMQQIAKGYSEDDLELIAGYFARLGRQPGR